MPPKEYAKLEEEKFPFLDCLTQIELCIMSYHLFAQSVLWPLDPWYETCGSKEARTRRMAAVRALLANSCWVEGVRGPGLACGFRDDEGRLDPILCRYKGRLKPWTRGLQFDGGKYILFEPNRPISRQIAATRICRFVPDKDPSGLWTITPPKQLMEYGVETFKLETNHDAIGNDLLVAFEGGHGVHGPGMDALWSMMGFVLRQETETGYDVHIVFRGSRSGDAVRAATQALRGKGNADWVTDMDNKKEIKHPFISEAAGVGRGFGNALVTGLPTLLKALLEVTKSDPPDQIFITGHSLGGALATLLAFSIAHGHFGETVGAMFELKKWPWKSLQVYTFSAPAAISDTAAKLLDKGLNPDFGGMRFERVKVASDPITTFKMQKHVGRKTSLPGEGRKKLNTARHEPMAVLNSLVRYLGSDYEVRHGLQLMKDYDKQPAKIETFLPDRFESFFILFNVFLLTKGSSMGLHVSDGYIGDNFKQVRKELYDEAKARKVLPGTYGGFALSTDPFLGHLRAFAEQLAWDPFVFDIKDHDELFDELEPKKDKGIKIEVLDEEEDVSIFGIDSRRLEKSSLLGLPKKKEDDGPPDPPSSFF